MKQSLSCALVGTLVAVLGGMLPVIFHGRPYHSAWWLHELQGALFFCGTLVLFGCLTILLPVYVLVPAKSRFSHPALGVAGGSIVGSSYLYLFLTEVFGAAPREVVNPFFLGFGAIIGAAVALTACWLKARERHAGERPKVLPPISAKVEPPPEAWNSGELRSMA